MILAQRRKVDLIRTGRYRLIVKIENLTKIDPVLDARSTYVPNQPSPTQQQQQQQKYHNDQMSFSFFRMASRLFAALILCMWSDPNKKIKKTAMSII
jgi:hypothetical protein